MSCRWKIWILNSSRKIHTFHIQQDSWNEPRQRQQKNKPQRACYWKRLDRSFIPIKLGRFLLSNWAWSVVSHPIEQWNQHRKISYNHYSIISVDELQRENITNFANENKEFIQKCQNGDEQACGKAVDMSGQILDFTGLPNPYNFVVQSYSFSLDDYITYLRLPNIRLFKLTKRFYPTYCND